MADRAVGVRRATEADATAIADVYLAAIRATYDFALAHTDTEVRRWIAEVLLADTETWVAVAHGRTIVGFMSLTDDMVDHLYVAPGWTGRGIGSGLIDVAKTRRPHGLDLCTVQVNAGARRFYERHGFRVIALGDGSGNEEGQPDVRYAWQAAAGS